MREKKFQEQKNDENKTTSGKESRVSNCKQQVNEWIDVRHREIRVTRKIKIIERVGNVLT